MLSSPRCAHNAHVAAGDMGRYPDPGQFGQAVAHLLKQAQGQQGGEPQILFVIIPRKGARFLFDMKSCCLLGVCHVCRC